MARQLTFDLPVRTALGQEDFVVSEANAEAVALCEPGVRWPGGKLALAGPEASGKSHLAHVWAERSDGIVVAAAALARLDIPSLSGAGSIAVEDVPAIAGDRKAEASLFHLHNLLLAEGGKLMVTGRDTPARWNIALPDLRSRLMAATLVKLAAPDDALLAALLRKQFADRQFRVDRKIIDYILPRMTRSCAATRDLVDRIDRLSLSEKKPVSIPLARQALEDAAGERPRSGPED